MGDGNKRGPVFHTRMLEVGDVYPFRETTPSKTHVNPKEN